LNKEKPMRDFKVKTRRHTGQEISNFKQALEDNLYYTRGTTIQSASPNDIYMALAYTVRDHLIDNWRKTTQAIYQANPRFVYYLSAEYLLGQQLTQNLLYTGTEELARQAFKDYDLDLDQIIELDVEPGLGNGGLGRLAACFMDSLATLGFPSTGYGIRYEFGIFKQSFKDGWQVESPDDWLALGNPWEFPQPDDKVEIGFEGQTVPYTDEQGNYRVRWEPGYCVLGEPYHMLVPGFETSTVNLLRLWRARATRDFDFQLFEEGDYTSAVEDKIRSESISKVLYPNDNNLQGKELRLKQQYFFVACSLQDIIRRYHFRNQGWDDFPKKVVIQLNDTHPTIAIPELMRILIDHEGLAWDTAWKITSQVFAYTCHTLLPEALEKWPLDLFGRLLPRHLEIILEINRRFLEQVSQRFPKDNPRLARMSLIEEGDEKLIRMAHLATVGSFSVNGVAELHSKLLQERTLHDFSEMWPDKFNNKTNGVSPRRFVRLANPRLSALITSKIGPGWLNNLERLSKLEAYIEDPDFRQAWREVKMQNKQDLARYILERDGIDLNPNSIFNVMVKRLHEYKRQLLKCLHIITLYLRIKDDPTLKFVPRDVIFGAKSAPGYQMAKLIIKLINSIANVINKDTDTNSLLKVAFPPNFNVALAERIYPAADISEQISLAGKEASGTGNMKFALNGALTTGTLDGANIEIRQRVGESNFFLFGLTADEAFALKENHYQPLDYYHSNDELKRAIDSIAEGLFSKGDRELFRPIIDSLLYKDEFLLLADYQSYIECQERATQVYLDQDHWTRMSILNTARCGFFSSDRSMRQYSAEIWKIEPVEIA
jgi:starch phosphorylase